MPFSSNIRPNVKIVLFFCTGAQLKNTNNSLTDWYETGEKIQDIWKDLRESCRESIMSNSIKKEEFIGKEK